MSEHVSFAEAKRRHFRTLEQYVPIVARVHGPSHPEFHDVRSVFDAIVGKVKEAGKHAPDLHEEFSRLREITHGYQVPADVCETYEAVYRMLAQLDEAYHE